MLYAHKLRGNTLNLTQTSPALKFHFGFYVFLADLSGQKVAGGLGQGGENSYVQDYHYERIFIENLPLINVANILIFLLH